MFDQLHCWVNLSIEPCSFWHDHDWQFNVSLLPDLHEFTKGIFQQTTPPNVLCHKLQHLKTEWKQAKSFTSSGWVPTQEWSRQQNLFWCLFQEDKLLCFCFIVVAPDSKLRGSRLSLLLFNNYYSLHFIQTGIVDSVKDITKFVILKYKVAVSFGWTSTLGRGAQKWFWNKHKYLTISKNDTNSRVTRTISEN